MGVSRHVELPGQLDVPHLAPGFRPGPFAYQGLEQARHPLLVACRPWADVLVALLKGFAAEAHVGAGPLEGVCRQIPRYLRKVNISLVVHPQDVIAGAVVMLGKQLLKLFGRWRSVQFIAFPLADLLPLSLKTTSRSF